MLRINRLTVLAAAVLCFIIVILLETSGAEDTNSESTVPAVSIDTPDNPAFNLESIQKELGELKQIYNRVFIIMSGMLLVLILSIGLSFNMRLKMNKTVKYFEDEFRKIGNDVDSRRAAAQPYGTPLSTSEMNRPGGDIEQKVDSLVSRVEQHDGQIERLSRKTASIEQDTARLINDTQTKRAVSQDPVSVFNDWAGNPTAPLPAGFYYLQNDMMRIKINQPLVKSPDETKKWITNSEGRIRYLFPNPNSFNEMTNISELYAITSGALRARGHNRISIVKPCNMTENGFIEFSGELMLL